MNMALIRRMALIIFLSVLVTNISANSYTQQPLYSRVYSPASDPFEDGRKALKLAAETDRRVLIEIGGDWCMYCHILDRFIQSNDDVAQQFYNAFVVLKVNVSDENKNRKFLSAFSGINGYPHIFITESNGRVIHSTGPAELNENGRHTKNMFFRFIERWQLKRK